MCDKVILENSMILMFVPDNQKIYKMCKKAVDNYSNGLEIVSDGLKTHMMYN